MADGFPMFRVLREESLREVNAKRTALKSEERMLFIQSMALAEDKARTEEKRRKAAKAKRTAPVVDGKVNLKAFEKLMLKGGA